MYQELKTFYQYHSQSLEQVGVLFLELAGLNNVFSEGTQKEIFQLNEILQANKTGNLPLDKFEGAVVGLIDLELFKEIVTGVNNKTLNNSLLVKAEHQIETLSVIFGLKILPNIYEAKELKDIFDNPNKENYGYFKLIRTLVEGIKDESNIELIRVLIPRIGEIFSAGRILFTFDEAVSATLYLHLLFSRLNLQEEEMQYYLLQNYFYRGEVAGVAVKEAIQDVLYATENVISYAFTSQKFLTTINESFEQVPLKLEAESEEKISSESLVEVLQKFEIFVGSDFLDEDKQKQFINDYYKEDSFVLKNWLLRVINNYAHLKNGDLILNNKGGELYPDEEFKNDVILLTAWLTVGESAEVDVVKYFSQEKSRVSLLAFVNLLKQFLDLEKDEYVQDCLKFTEILHRNSLLAIDQELIAYHEEDGKFHWVE